MSIGGVVAPSISEGSYPIGYPHEELTGLDNIATCTIVVKPPSLNTVYDVSLVLGHANLRFKNLMVRQMPENMTKLNRVAMVMAIITGISMVNRSCQLMTNTIRPLLLWQR